MSIIKIIFQIYVAHFSHAQNHPAITDKALDRLL